MIVRGPKLHGEFLEAAAAAAAASADPPPVDGNNTKNKTKNKNKCDRQLEAVRTKKKIDLTAIGSRPNNALLEFLKCRTKFGAGYPQENRQQQHQEQHHQRCRALEKSYGNCHASVMGTGAFDGKKHCGDELREWLDCVRTAAS